MSEPTTTDFRGMDFRDSRGVPVPHDGTTPVTWRVGAYALARRDGRVLMVEPVHSDRWELPGGGVEIDETVVEAATRECLEETGYRFVITDPVPVYVGELFFFWRQHAAPSPGPRYWHALMLVFHGVTEGDALPDGPPDPSEIRRVRWIDPVTLTPEMTQSHHWAALQRAGLV
jgi:8-oxo-dGTP pyrophosphatase MutT (NUDIX family)